MRRDACSVLSVPYVFSVQCTVSGAHEDHLQYTGGAASGHPLVFVRIRMKTNRMAAQGQCMFWVAQHEPDIRVNNLRQKYWALLIAGTVFVICTHDGRLHGQAESVTASVVNCHTWPMNCHRISYSANHGTLRFIVTDPPITASRGSHSSQLSPLFSALQLSFQMPAVRETVSARSAAYIFRMSCEM